MRKIAVMVLLICMFCTLVACGESKYASECAAIVGLSTSTDVVEGVVSPQVIFSATDRNIYCIVNYINIAKNTRIGVKLYLGRNLVGETSFVAQEQILENVISTDLWQGDSSWTPGRYRVEVSGTLGKKETFNVFKEFDVVE